MDGAVVIMLPETATSSKDDELAVLGMHLWPHTFAKTEDLFHARQWFFGTMIKKGMPLPQIQSASVAAMMAVQWAHYAYPSILAGHKFAAALMSTNSRLESMDDIHVPWLAFRAIVPDGLLDLDGRPVNRIMVSRSVMDGNILDDEFNEPGDVYIAWVLEMYDNSTGKRVMLAFHRSLHGVLTETVSADRSFTFDYDDHQGPLDKSAHAQAQRLLVLCQRYVLGLLVTLQSHPQFQGPRERPVPPESKHRDGPPKHRTFVLGTPIQADCRAAVREYLTGGRHAPPSFQSLVIGHWKRQVIGVGRSGRKVIHIEPYWRGPEEAPILVRPRSVGKESI